MVVIFGCLTLVVVPDRDGWQPLEPTIVIDPGHGGNDEGARGNGLLEKDLALETALELEVFLRERGIQTVLTRSEDRYVSLAQRVAVANTIENALFVSIHFNKSARGINGVETFYAGSKIAPEQKWSWAGIFNRPAPLEVRESAALAGFIQAATARRLEAANRGIKPEKLYVVRHTRHPAVLIEAGFLSDRLEARLLATDAYRQLLAGAIAEGIIEYLAKDPQNRWCAARFAPLADSFE